MQFVPRSYVLSGIPVDEEKRMVRGVLGALKWCALLSVLASDVGVKVPVRRRPRA